MKKGILLVAVALIALCSACNKEKHCRCAVLGNQTVRIITVKNNTSCEKINNASYYDDLDTLHIDSLLCIDYPFDADSTIVYR